MATIIAKSKYGKKFKVSVEDKHKYYNFDSQTIYLNKTSTGKAEDNGFNIGQNCVVAYNLSNNINIAQGTHDDERIGNKVYMKFIHFTYTLGLNGGSLITNLPHGDIADLFLRFRVMVVQFDDEKTEQQIVEWFRNTYIYFKNMTVGGTTWPCQSVHQTKLRESTPYTGKFKILYDKKLKMGKKKTIKISNISIPIKQNINFENTNNKATDDNFKNIYAIFIGPCYNDVDTDSISSDKTYSFIAESVSLASINAVMKYEYYDI